MFLQYQAPFSSTDPVPDDRLTLSLTEVVGGMAENLGAAVVDLTPDDLREIEAGAAQITAHGDRCSEAAQKMINP